MPELPDVEVFGRRMRAHGVNRRIAAVDLRDPERLRGASAADLGTALAGRTFEAVHRHGKVLFVQVSGDGHLVLHFGMTGFVAFYDEPAQEPRYARFVLAFEDGGWFAVDDRRRLGWLELAEDVSAYLRAQGLGPDALSVDAAALRGLCAGKRGKVKSLLMDQEKIAGIGNEYSDEILFNAGVRPDRAASTLSAAEVDRLHAQMQEVLRTAVACDVNPAAMPKHWLMPGRGRGAPCPRCGGGLETSKVGGRTAYFCPLCQS